MPTGLDLPREAIADAARLSALLANSTDGIRMEFLRLVGGARGVRSLEQIADLIATGRTLEALDVMDQVGPGLITAIELAYLRAGHSTMTVLQTHPAAQFLNFNLLNNDSVQAMQSTRLRLVSNLTTDQRRATLLALQDGLRVGDSPIAIARRVLNSVGLSARQVQAVNTYRQQLRTLNSRALLFATRDKRFDGMVQRAIRTGTPLSDDQIERMVARYEERALVQRSRRIAETEALMAVNTADDQLWNQAVAFGGLDPNDIVSTWITRQDLKVRDSHAPMHGQTRPFGEAFVSAHGNRLMYPGDPSAPAGEVVNCRCVRARTLAGPAA